MFSIANRLVKQTKPLVSHTSVRTIVKTFRTGEVGARFTLGKFSGIIQPGPILYFPGLHRFVRINTQIITHEMGKMKFPVQGGASVEVDGFVEYKVVDPEKCVNTVRNSDASQQCQFLKFCQRRVN
jgi:regulator of protease activity HflC (stomatin/prohibitin superfamily)